MEVWFGLYMLQRLQTKFQIARQMLMQTSNIKFKILKACKRGVKYQTIQIIKEIKFMSTENTVQSSKSTNSWVDLH